MAKMSVVKKYNSMHFTVPKGARPNDYESNFRISMSLSLDMTLIKEKTGGAAGFFKICELYYKDRKHMITASKGKYKDATLEAHKMTLLTICGETVMEACNLLNMDYHDTHLDIETKYNSDGKTVGGTLALGIKKGVPEQKRTALNAIFNEFQSKLGDFGVKTKEATLTEAMEYAQVNDADFSDIGDVEIDDIEAKA
tara:strand:- start:286 stop:876 length:591 start_codon:yes stop_codon:yes gene_type:complete